MCLDIQNQRPLQLMLPRLLEIAIFLYIPTFYSCKSSTSKREQRQDQSSYSGTGLVNLILVPSANADDHPRATIFSTINKKPDS